MKALLEAVKNVIYFSGSFWFLNCMKSMLAGLFVMAFLSAARSFSKSRPEMRYVLWMFLPCMFFMGRSKLFFTGKLIYISDFLNFWLKELPAIGVAYVCVMGILIIRILWKFWKFMQYLKQLPEYGNNELKKDITDRIVCFISGNQDETKQYRQTFKQEFMRIYLYRCKWVVMPEKVSSFSVGVLRPYVVIPQYYLERFNRKELTMILMHEMLHIAGGHLLLLQIFSFLKAYWWVNPFMHYCDKIMQQDMEALCDEQTIKCMQCAPQDYGILLLKAAGAAQLKVSGAATFYGAFYRDTKRRITSILQYGEKAYAKKGRRRYCRCGHPVRQNACILSVVLLLAIMATSYPRYTEYTDLILYDHAGNILDRDTKRLSEIFKVNGKEISYDAPAFSAYLKERKYAESQFYVSYGGFMKMPGVGGGGFLVYLNWSGERQLESAVREDFITEIEMWILKWI